MATHQRWPLREVLSRGVVLCLEGAVSAAALPEAVSCSPFHSTPPLGRSCGPPNLAFSAPPLGLLRVCPLGVLPQEISSLGVLSLRGSPMGVCPFGVLLLRWRLSYLEGGSEDGEMEKIPKLGRAGSQSSVRGEKGEDEGRGGGGRDKENVL